MKRPLVNQWLAVFFFSLLSCGGGELPGQEISFNRADANSDGPVDIGDPVFALGWRFLGGPPPGCADAAVAPAGVAREPASVSSPTSAR